MTDPDAVTALPLPGRRWRRLGLAVLVAGGLAWPGWAGREGVRWLRTRADRHAAHRLTWGPRLRTEPFPYNLTDDEFVEALGLCDSSDPYVRGTALNFVLVEAAGWGGHPPRRADFKCHALPVAVRLLADPDPGVRRLARTTVFALGGKDHVHLIRPFLRAPDPEERRHAEWLVAKLEGRPTEPGR